MDRLTYVLVHAPKFGESRHWPGAGCALPGVDARGISIYEPTRTLMYFFFFPIPEIQIVRPYPATLQATGWMGSKSGRFEPQITPLMASVCMYIDTVCGVCDV